MSSEAKKERLPFEPKQNKKKPAKKPPAVSTSLPDKSKAAKSEASLSAIPDAVSRRMVRRMALFAGIPTALGISSFVVFYLIAKQEWFNLPNVVVLLVSMLFFGLGVLGLSYGIFSTSWDENIVGSWWGWQEFRLNFGRTINAWRTSRAEAKNRP